MSRCALLLVLCALPAWPLWATDATPESPPAVFLRPSPVAADFADSVLEAELRRLAGEVRGRVGIYARRLGTGQEVSIHADEVFPTASIIKIPLLVGLFAAMDEGRFQLLDELPYDTSLSTHGGGDVLNKLRAGQTVALWRIAGLMTMLGDHVAARWVQQLVGGETVNDWLADREFEHTRVNGRVEGREEAYDTYGWGQSTRSTPRTQC